MTKVPLKEDRRMACIDRVLSVTAVVDGTPDMEKTIEQAKKLEAYLKERG